jgi:hypothetical protein
MSDFWDSFREGLDLTFPMVFLEASLAKVFFGRNPIYTAVIVCAVASSILMRRVISLPPLTEPHFGLIEVK